MSDRNVGGYDTARVAIAASEEDRRRRAARDGRARANLEAYALQQHPDDLSAAKAWFDEACSLLGLSTAPPATPPGMCVVCGKEVPVSYAIRSYGGARAGICSTACARREVAQRLSGLRWSGREGL